MAALENGVCKTVTKTAGENAFGTVTSTTFNSFSPLEAGRDMKADGLAEQVAVDCA